MTDKYILDAAGNPVPEPDLIAWAEWYETANRRVRLTEISPDIKVSTVFLGMDHSFNGPPPMLFETMIFGGPNDEEQARYSTREEAIAGHERMCALAVQQ